MSYTALYRKFRPSTFEDVKGQDHIVTTLKNQIRADRIGHAYLFCGTRGTGKTTIAKILARSVNCEHPVDGSPCNECPTCKAILAGVSTNVIEIDAASNNGVDNIREIREEVAYRPTQGRYKVYIIDEVHMLSTGAFNALLKTLEEPPSYVIFILATTEANKIPVTILSRCQRYDFRRITIDTIAARLSELMEKEGVDVEEKAIRYVAKAGDGSMRDALSLLDQCIAFYLGQKLTYDKVLEVLGTVDTEIFSQMLRTILAGDVTGSIRTLETLTGVDLIIDDTPEAITVSSFDPVRREVARLALEKLIADGRIHPTRIEDMVEKARREVDHTIKVEGERAAFETGVHNLHPEIIKLLGRQKYRTSYGQNVLNHSIEVAHIAGLLASELGVDVTLAKRAGLLHDLGKSVDHEMEGSHVQLGVELAKKYKENPVVINAIEAHHGDVEPHTVVACLVQAADAISASRPGARRENIESYVKRLEKLEEVSKSFPGIASSYAIQAGREIRIMVKPEEVSEDQMVLLARDIAKKIEDELTYPGQIKVHVLRETKAVDYAK